MLLSSTCLCTNTLPHHDACRQLRERMAADREAAVEAERTSAHKRLADAAERYEASAQQARMRLAAEHDRRLAEQEDAARAQRYEFEIRFHTLNQKTLAKKCPSLTACAHRAHRSTAPLCMHGSSCKLLVQARADRRAVQSASSGGGGGGGARHRHCGGA